MGVFDLCHLALLKRGRAVQIRVGLELAEFGHLLVSFLSFLTFSVTLLPIPFCLPSSKTKTLQMVTLRVKISLFFFALGNFGTGGKQQHGRELRADFLKWNFACAQFSLALLPFEMF